MDRVTCKLEGGIHRYLHLRLLGRDSIQRNLRVVRTLLTQPGSYMRPLWKRTSKKDIRCLDHQLFFDNFSTVVSTAGQRLFALSVFDRDEKIIEVCRYEMPSARPARPRLFCLTNKGFLQVHDNATGQLLQRYPLGSRKFKHLCWETMPYTMAVKCTVGSDIEMIIFEPEPMCVVVRFAVSRQTFGPNVTSAYVLHGLLYVMSRGDVIHVYSVDQLLRDNPPSPPSSMPIEERSFLDAPRANITVAMPLRKFLTKDHFLDWGGFPLSSLSCPERPGAFSVRSLQPKDSAVADVALPLSPLADPPQASFFDEHRLLLQDSHSFSVYRFTERMDATQPRRFECSFRVDSAAPDGGQVPTDPGSGSISRSGRKLKLRDPSLFESNARQPMHCIEYENELDLISAVIDGYLHVYCALTGRLLQKFSICFSWRQEGEALRNVVILDRDRVIHLSCLNGSATSVQVYEWRRGDDQMVE